MNEHQQHSELVAKSTPETRHGETPGGRVELKGQFENVRADIASTDAMIKKAEGSDVPAKSLGPLRARLHQSTDDFAHLEEKIGLTDIPPYTGITDEPPKTGLTDIPNYSGITDGPQETGITPLEEGETAFRGMNPFSSLEQSPEKKFEAFKVVFDAFTTEENPLRGRMADTGRFYAETIKENQQNKTLIARAREYFLKILLPLIVQEAQATGADTASSSDMLQMYDALSVDPELQTVLREHVRTIVANELGGAEGDGNREYVDRVLAMLKPPFDAEYFKIKMGEWGHLRFAQSPDAPFQRMAIIGSDGSVAYSKGIKQEEMISPQPRSEKKEGEGDYLGEKLAELNSLLEQKLEEARKQFKEDDDPNMKIWVNGQNILKLRADASGRNVARLEKQLEAVKQGLRAIRGVEDGDKKTIKSNLTKREISLETEGEELKKKHRELNERLLEQKHELEVSRTEYHRYDREKPEPYVAFVREIDKIETQMYAAEAREKEIEKTLRDLREAHQVISMINQTTIPTEFVQSLIEEIPPWKGSGVPITNPGFEADFRRNERIGQLLVHDLPGAENALSQARASGTGDTTSLQNNVDTLTQELERLRETKN